MTTTPNNEIISRLLSDAGTHIPESSDNQVQSLASARVVTTRYKVYLLVIVAMIYIFTMYMFLPTLDRQQAQQASLQNVVNQLQNFEAKRLQYVADAEFIQQLNQQEEILLSCINNQTGCDALNPILQDRQDLAMLFLKFNSIIDPIMGVNERRILASLNDYALILKPYASSARERNGVIQSIRIADPVLYDGNIYRLPITLSIQFANQNGLLSFIHNIENTIPTLAEYRLLYMIDQIDYDVVRYQEQQQADIQLSLFYYIP